LLHFVRNDGEGMRVQGALPEMEVDSEPTAAIATRRQSNPGGFRHRPG
jgi:hypothetical protein